MPRRRTLYSSPLDLWRNCWLWRLLRRTQLQWVTSHFIDCPTHYTTSSSVDYKPNPFRIPQIWTGRLKTRDLASRYHQNCEDWHRETSNAAPYRKGGHRETCFSVRVDAHYEFMFYSASIIWASRRFMFVVLFLSVLLIATCGRLSWPALWSKFWRTIKWWCVIDW